MDKYNFVLDSWKNLRKQIQKIDTYDKLQNINDYFTTYDLSSRIIDYYSPETWPDPWQILSESKICKDMILLMKYYTLQIDGLDNLKIILCNHASDRLLILVVNNKYVLRGDSETVFNWCDFQREIVIIEEFKKERLKKLR